MRHMLLLVSIFLLLAQVALAGEQVFFYHTDPAGTPLSMTDTAGTVVWKADYRPFGEEHSIESVTENNRRFSGKEADKETGLVYFGARYESAKLGRFIAPDPIRAVDPETNKTNETMLTNPQGLNTYAYALNNPYRYLDPDGREPISELGLRIVKSEPFIRFGEFIGASQLNAALTGSDFRGNEVSGVGRIAQLTVALSSAPVSRAERGLIDQINPRNLIPTQSRSDMSGSLVKRYTKDMKMNGYDQSKPIEAIRNASGRLEIQDGHHRTQAAINAGINKVPVRIKE